MNKVYTCQSCGKVFYEASEGKILAVMGIGFVTCKDCLEGFADA